MAKYFDTLVNQDHLRYKFNFIDTFLNVHESTYLNENKYLKIFVMTIALTMAILSLNLLNNRFIKFLFSLVGISSLFLLSLLILTSSSTLFGFVGAFFIVLLLHINLLPSLAHALKLFFYSNEHNNDHIEHKESKHKKKNRCHKTKEMKTCDLLKICDISSKTFRYGTTELNDKLFNYSIV